MAKSDDQAEITNQVVDSLRRIGRVASAPEVAREWERVHGGSMHQTKAFRHLRSAVKAGRVLQDEKKRWLLPEWAGGPQASATPQASAQMNESPSQDAMAKAAAPLLRAASASIEAEPADVASAITYMDSAYNLLRARRAS